MYRNDFTVPSYYKNFRCKGGSCRTCCCDGWAVTVSLREYFTLLGLSCPEDLRKRLDRAMHLLKDADEERYAEIVPTFYGVCPMQREDGYCLLQCECGEESLPAVCRYYPRSPRLTARPECCISCSCEKVLEDLFADPEKLTFESRPLSFDLDLTEASELPEKYDEYREKCLELLQNREKSLSNRLDDIIRFLSVSSKEPSLYTEQNYLAKETVRELLRLYSDSAIGDLCVRALDTFSESFDYEIIKKTVLDKFPNAEFWAEKVLSNHFFFMKFPFVPPKEKLSDAARGLAALTILWLVLTANDNVKTEEDFIDATVRLFRVAEHSPFYKNAAILAKK